MGRKTGYARVPALHQNLDRQIAALRAEECDRIFREKASSKSTKDRPELEKAIDALAIGDILVSEIAPPPLTPALLQLREPPAQWVECHHDDGPHNVDSIQ